MARPHLALFVTTVSVAGCAAACQESGAKPSEISAAQLAESLKGARPPLVYDANGERTRREYGVIPGAYLLPNSSDYPLDFLPEDRQRQLVFYCASSWCGAAEDAAERAIQAGYASVQVLPDGIKGWTRAGMPTEALVAARR